MSDGLASALGATLVCGIPQSVKKAIGTGSDPAKLNPATEDQPSAPGGLDLGDDDVLSLRVAGIILPLPHLVALMVPLGMKN